MKQNTSLGKLIHDTREKIGLSQRELARQANMDYAEISRIESGKRLKPNILYLKGISEVLNLSMVDLMKLAGYNKIAIDWGKQLKATKDYQSQIESYKSFYFDVLEYIEERRKVSFTIKGELADLIERIEYAKLEKKEISNEEILENLKELISLIKPNLEKFDKSKYSIK